MRRSEPGAGDSAERTDPFARYSYWSVPDPEAGEAEGPPARKNFTSMSTPVAGRAVLRPKKTRHVRWLVLHLDGSRDFQRLDKRTLVQNLSLGVSIRDMRLMDSHFVNYDTIGQIAVRENTIVFSIEHVKALITPDKVVLPIEEDRPSEVQERFISVLEDMLLARPGGHDRRRRVASDNAHHDQAMFHDNDDEAMPFELRVLETALSEICNLLAREVEILHQKAQSALEDLTKEADQPTLERVRRIKTGHQRMVGRVKLVREVLDRYLEDDDDMLRCYLSRTDWRANAAAATSALSNANSMADALFSGFPSEGTPYGGFSGTESPSAFGLSPIAQAQAVAARQAAAAAQEAVEAEEADLLRVESLFESYLMLVDSTFQRLERIGEYIDDTEDLINIQLDYARNKLIRFEAGPNWSGYGCITCGAAVRL
mmetsp:Transcript_16540/g.49302  ORF Transcript_16540/g.49302 Transcript_16540/m.49302 type:complete len:428 (-) Transcript_16540:775-2058(-)